MSFGGHEQRDAMPADLDASAPEIGVEAQASFDPYPRAVPQARAFVLSLPWVTDEETHARLATLTSEVVTNAVLHARTEFVVTVTRFSTHLRVSVADRDVQPVMRKSYGPTSPTGRGLHIVEALADRWGIDERKDGKTVWFELDKEMRSK